MHIQKTVENLIAAVENEQPIDADFKAALTRAWAAGEAQQYQIQWRVGDDRLIVDGWSGDRRFVSVDVAITGLEQNPEFVLTNALEMIHGTATGQTE